MGDPEVVGGWHPEPDDSWRGELHPDTADDDWPWEQAGPEWRMWRDRLAEEGEG
jgi:hypothetical protein